MRRILHVGVAAFLVLAVMSVTASPTQAAVPKPGTACKYQEQKIVYKGLTYTCTKSGTKLIWSKGLKLPLRVITKVLPAAITGVQYFGAIEVTGGTGYHQCSLQRGSGLPHGYSLDRNGCEIIGVGEVLPPGTTARISPPFTIVVTDSATPKPAMIKVTFTIKTMGSPVITLSMAVVHCQVDKECNVLVATASAGITPYTFESGTGFPPTGLEISTIGGKAYLTGTPLVAGSEIFEVCVLDFVRSEDCENISVIVDATPTMAIKVNMNGDGGGSISSDPYGLNCDQNCQENFSLGSKVTLLAHPADGSAFRGWSGDCTGIDVCTLDLTVNRNVTATFSLTATGTYSGTAMWPNLSTPPYTGCPAKSYTFTLGIRESEGGKISGGGEYSFSGTRSGNTMTVTVDTLHGPRGPYVWQWNGTTLSGTLPALCQPSSLVALMESSFTFNFSRVSYDVLVH